jgi:hypothetical protein
MRNLFPEIRMDRNGFFGFEPSLVEDFFKLITANLTFWSLTWEDLKKFGIM